MADLIRAACLTHYADVARSVGIDARQMLKSVGLPERSLTDPDIKIPTDSFRRLLEAPGGPSELDRGPGRLSRRPGLLG